MSNADTFAARKISTFLAPGTFALPDANPHHARMTTTALFPALLGKDVWLQLPDAVRAMHGDAVELHAKGMADVNGAEHFFARGLRYVLGLPQPGPKQALALTISRRGTHETWTRLFAHRRMQSELDLRKGSPLLHEKMGLVTLGFTLRHDGDAIDWQLRKLTVLGVPMPRALRGQVLSRSGTQDGRYHFIVDVRLPFLGQLIGYCGWLTLTPDAN